MSPESSAAVDSEEAVNGFLPRRSSTIAVYDDDLSRRKQACEINRLRKQNLRLSHAEIRLSTRVNIKDHLSPLGNKEPLCPSNFSEEKSIQKSTGAH